MIGLWWWWSRGKGWLRVYSSPIVIFVLWAVVALTQEVVSPCFGMQMKLGGHTGWVRSLAMSGKFLFRCVCMAVWRCKQH